ncbi:MAG: permease [Eubacteriales bacterium]|nr:permease [Eubacteriales bacterium]MDD4323215.1 permease [Eubacteriales bacterium]MDD4542088.1 permease [Eubacteriales bacterium]
MKLIKKYKWQILVVLILILMAIFVPENVATSFDTILGFAKEMLIVLPPIFIVVGLLEAWISQENIEKWLGQESGLKGMLIAMALGTLPAGPLYAAFPVGTSLLSKGASYRNIIVFLSSWAALKIPHIMMEFGALGPKFAVTRLLLTAVLIIPMALLMEFILLRTKPDKPELAT